MTTNRHSKIDSWESLQAEKERVKKRIREDEHNLAQRWERLPQETFKATIGAVVPVFRNASIAGAAWKLLKGAFTLFSGKKKKEEENDTAKQAGLMSILKLAYSLFKK